MTDRFATQRISMVDQQLRRRGLRDEGVLRAMSIVPRHLFVPRAVRDSAYDDMPLPIGLGQTISQPYMVALMTSALELHGTERVLEIGTGSGYQAAVLALLAAELHTVEFLPQLSMRAGRVLRRLGLGGVQLHVGDGSLGCPQNAPFNAIMVTAAAPATPEPLVEQLAEGGRLVIPLSGGSDYQVLTLVTCNAGRVTERGLGSVVFVPLRGQHGMRL